MLIDLHTHSTASDGTDSPAELVVAARAADLDVVALTDHDTTVGWAPAVAALPPGLTLVPGLELSCRWNPPDGSRSTELHLLGYLVDPAHPELAATLDRLRSSRLGRAQRMTERMAAGGIPVRWERVAQLAEGASAGRPHIARALVETGIVGSVDEAFATLLSSRSPYHEPKEDLDALAGVALVLAAGGVPVFAHPLARMRGRVVGDDAVRAMAAAGLAGLEVDHPDHTEADREHLREVAAELGLLVTGSSDYHGTNKRVRVGGGGLTASDQYDKLVSMATGSVPVVG
ncbi:MAG TPA: PHP domain-containing protein [Mycobacteriales bacterium]|jgi:predicted metal-dependent phosphoesterase TrpH|nr:PHP domain-containing protein [Mycobacteriales bacterium]